MKIPHAFLPALLMAATGAALIAPGTLRADRHADVGVAIGVPLPHGYLDIVVGRDHYYSYRGVFYRRGPHGYMVVRAPRGAVVRVLPPHCARIYAGNVVYYRFGDVYYQPVRQGYVVVDPPTTVTLPPAPPPAEEYQSVWVGQTEFQFKDGQFFQKTPDGLVWVEAPLGAITRTLPSDATSVWYQDTEFFECDNVYFRKTPEGYKVVPKPWKD
ncbi:MAG TPA: DUF6515 family protein [Opitutaceae bacterium]|nr:DUF6515 family protein [Opitutaceae bacterium]